MRRLNDVKVSESKTVQLICHVGQTGRDRDCYRELHSKFRWARCAQRHGCRPTPKNQSFKPLEGKDAGLIFDRTQTVPIGSLLMAVLQKLIRQVAVTPA